MDIDLNGQSSLCHIVKSYLFFMVFFHNHLKEKMINKKHGNDIYSNGSSKFLSKYPLCSFAW